MNTIKQAKHINDVTLGKYGTIKIHRSGANSDGTFTWVAEMDINGKTYDGWGTTEEEARTNVVQAYKEGKWTYDHSGGSISRFDGSRLATAIQVGNNEWWRVVQKTLPNDKLVERDDKNKKITIRLEIPEPIKNILLMTEIFKLTNEKIESPEMKLTPGQIDEYVKRLYPILSYSGLWLDQITKDELNDFYGVENQEG